ncbi:PPK2 family polyphosphate kinase [Mesobacillus foraminis]|uniref:PPK2 family polyphosphate:nucleotide phosphotransferase n=1 Tax=Mesobacillus foraminis TaxID=279826 RepID=A0A4R2ATY3_9BACI|nr:PPK2 family polyphosphate kinase [Mesobacillus foraminis]TCN17216.1 PPK2 family polyphosphate:nucleotide phosphotransferase [Mesobacillus foraminis]
METRKYLVEENKNVKLFEYSTTEENRIEEKELLEKMIPSSVSKLKDLHWRLYAESKKGILVVLQAMDAAGKDEAISYIFSNLNAQGLKTTSFKKPSDTELSHDFLWRVHKGLPARGEISILNRSYYEDVIVPRIHGFAGEDVIPNDLDKDKICMMRYRHINEFERYMVENGFEVVKFFFNVSKEEQRKRLLERMKDPKKNWEFSFNDVKERKHWDRYQAVFEDMLSHTSTSYAPWYILPADDEWYSRYILTEVMIELLEKINPKFPEISEENQKKLDKYIEMLENE